jgi:transposase
VEGCGSYGTGLARFLADHGEAAFECERPRRGDRRGGKNDVIDATLAARRVVSGEGLSLPRGAGRREQLRLLLLERRGAARARTAALNQPDAVIVTMPDDQRQRLGRVPERQLVTTAARLRPSRDGASDVARRIARRMRLQPDNAPTRVRWGVDGVRSAGTIVARTDDQWRLRRENPCRTGT